MSARLPEGTIIEGRYRIISLLGQGGVGTVYKAEQEGIERLVAIKFLQENSIQDKENWDRFKREGQILSELRHKNIPQMFQFGFYQEAIPYIVMEYLPGNSLRKELNEQDHLDWKRALNIAAQICDAMEHAHKASIVHRDLKPDNLILLQEANEDLVKVCDFGLARFAGPDREHKQNTLTKTGLLIGTANYMSPEQCAGKKADHLSDIYSLSCIIYEMLSGSPPFTADTAVGVIYKHINETAAPLPQSKNLPPGLEQIIAKGMSKDPKARYQSMKEFHDDLKLVLAGGIPESANLVNEKKRNWALIAGVPLLIVAAIVGCAVYTKYHQSQSRRNSSAFINIRKSRIKALVKTNEELVKERSILINDKKYEEAKEITDELIKRYKRSSEPYNIVRAWLNLSDLERAMNKLDRSAECIDRAADVLHAIGPTLENVNADVVASVHLHRGMLNFEKWRRDNKPSDLLKAQHDAAAALAICQESLNKKQSFEPARILLATCYFWQKKDAELRNLVGNDPNFHCDQYPIFTDILFSDREYIEALPEPLSIMDGKEKEFEVYLPQYYTLLAHNTLREGKLKDASELIKLSEKWYQQIFETKQFRKMAAVYPPKGSKAAKTEFAYQTIDQCAKSRNEDALTFLSYAELATRHLNAIGDWRSAKQALMDQVQRFLSISTEKKQNYLQQLTAYEVAGLSLTYTEVLLKDPEQSSEDLLLNLLEQSAQGSRSRAALCMIYTGSAQTLARAGRLDLAIRLCQKYFALPPAEGQDVVHDCAAMSILANCYVQANKFPEAEKCLRQLVEIANKMKMTSTKKDVREAIDQTVLSASTYLSYILLAQNKHRPAEAALQKIIATHSQNGLNRADVEAMMNVLGEFYRYYSRSAEEKAKLQVIYYKQKMELAVLNSRFHSKEELIECAYQQVLGRAPDSSELGEKARNMRLLNNTNVRRLFLDLLLGDEFSSQLKSLKNHSECIGLFRKVFDTESDKSGEKLWRAIESKSHTQLRAELIEQVYGSEFRKKMGLFHPDMAPLSVSVYDFQHNGLSFWREGKYKDAVQEFEKGLNLDASNAGILVGLGSCYQALSNNEAALRCYNKAIEIDPLFNVTYLERASLYLAMGDKGACVRDLQKADSLNAKDALINWVLKEKKTTSKMKADDVFIAIARSLHEQKDYNGTIHYFSKALAIPESRQKDAILNMRALTFWRMELSEQCRLDLLATKRVDSHCLQVLAQCAQHYSSLLEYAKAIGLLERAVSQHPRNFDLWRQLAETYSFANQKDKQKETLERATIALQPKTASEYDKLGWCALIRWNNGEQTDEVKKIAIGSYSKAVDLEPKNQHWLLARAQCQWGMNEREAATRDYNKAATMKSTEDWECQILGQHYKDTLKDYPNALKWFKKGREFAPGDPHFSDLIAECYYLMNDKTNYRKHFINLK